MHDLIVISPFAGYTIGQRITDDAEVAKILADPRKAARCQKVFQDSRPEEPEAPPAPVPPPPTEDGKSSAKA